MEEENESVETICMGVMHRDIVFIWRLQQLFKQGLRCFNRRYEWRINTVQTSKDGTVVACTKEMKPVYGDVLELDITCTAKDGVLILRGAANEMAAKGSYKKIEAHEQTVLYEVAFNEQVGSAACSVTDSSYGSKTPTLVFSISNYTLHCFPNA